MSTRVCASPGADVSEWLALLSHTSSVLGVKTLPAEWQVCFICLLLFLWLNGGKTSAVNAERGDYFSSFMAEKKTNWTYNNLRVKQRHWKATLEIWVPSECRYVLWTTLCHNYHLSFMTFTFFLSVTLSHLQHTGTPTGLGESVMIK